MHILQKEPQWTGSLSGVYGHDTKQRSFECRATQQDYLDTFVMAILYPCKTHLQNRSSLGR